MGYRDTFTEGMRLWDAMNRSQRAELLRETFSKNKKPLTQPDALAGMTKEQILQLMSEVFGGK